MKDVRRSRITIAPATIAITINPPAATPIKGITFIKTDRIAKSAELPPRRSVKNDRVSGEQKRLAGEEPVQPLGEKIVFMLDLGANLIVNILDIERHQWLLL
jgi:hypothetical protein